MPPCSGFPLPPEKCCYFAYGFRIVDRLNQCRFSPLLQLGQVPRRFLDFKADFDDTMHAHERLLMSPLDAPLENQAFIGWACALMVSSVHVSNRYLANIRSISR